MLYSVSSRNVLERRVESDLSRGLGDSFRYVLYLCEMSRSKIIHINLEPQIFDTCNNKYNQTSLYAGEYNLGAHEWTQIYSSHNINPNSNLFFTYSL